MPTANAHTEELGAVPVRSVGHGRPFGHIPRGLGALWDSVKDDEEVRAAFLRMASPEATTFEEVFRLHRFSEGMAYELHDWLIEHMGFSLEPYAHDRVDRYVTYSGDGEGPEPKHVVCAVAGRHVGYLSERGPNMSFEEMHRAQMSAETDETLTSRLANAFDRDGGGISSASSVSLYVVPKSCHCCS